MAQAINIESYAIRRIAGREHVAAEFLQVFTEELYRFPAYRKFCDSLLAEIDQEEDPYQSLGNLSKTMQRRDSTVLRSDIEPYEHLPNDVWSKEKWRKWLLKTSVQLMLMVDCSIAQVGFAVEIDGYQPTIWSENEPLTEFFKRAFPKKVSADIKDFERTKHEIKAWKLKKRAYLKFLPTDNLTEHLLYDPRSNSVRIFHHTAWLKAQLQRSSSLDFDCSWEKALKLGTLPPRLLYETLHSIQFVLFPAWDSKSAPILKLLVDSNNFDEDCLLHDGHIREIPPGFEYLFWGTRLGKLNIAVNNPKPRGPIHSWLQRHTNEKNGFVIALVALILGAFFSLLSVIIGIIQTWLSWKAWRNPVG